MIRIKTLKPAATLRAVLPLYVAVWNPAISPRTHRKYRHELNRWESLTSNPPVGEITTETFQRFRAASAAAGHKASTTETTLRCVRSLMRCALGNGVIDTMPDRGRARRIQLPEPNPPSVENVDAFLAHVGVARWPKLHVTPAMFWTSVVAVACWTGMRRHDLLWRLKWEHVDFDSMCIVFRASKTGKRHAFPITPMLESHLRYMEPSWDYDESFPVFGPSQSPHFVSRTLREIAEAAGIEAFGMQQLRQFAINQWTTADPEAGRLIHGMNIGVMKHYIDPLRILRAVADRVVMPSGL